MASVVVAPAALAALPRRARVPCRAAATSNNGFVVASNKGGALVKGFGRVVVGREGVSAAALRSRAAPLAARRGASVITAATGDDGKEVSAQMTPAPPSLDLYHLSFHRGKTNSRSRPPHRKKRKKRKKATCVR